MDLSLLSEFRQIVGPASLFQADDSDWWEDARSGDLVQAGLKAVARWLTGSP